MKRIMFVCHGNICRSPMAEFIFKDMIKRRGQRITFLSIRLPQVPKKYGTESEIQFIHRQKKSLQGIKLTVRASVLSN